MEVLDDKRALTNREVLELIRECPVKSNSQLATILYETTAYLEASPAATYSLSGLEDFAASLRDKKYNLSSQEKLQIANLKPQKDIELHLIVDNLDERFDMQQRQDILDIVANKLIKKDNDDDHKRKKSKH